MVKIPIPDDWNGQAYHCVQLVWPNSPKWNAILAGLILTPSRGRFWDERTGSIINAQSIGHEIDALNIPFNPCGEDAAIPLIDAGFLSGLSVCESDGLCDMGCSIPYGSIRWSGGFLQYLHCGIWYNVEGPVAVDTPIGDDYLPPEIDAGGYSACGKADAVMAMVWNVINSILDEVGNLSLQYWGHVKGDNPGVGMDAKWIVLACFGAVNQSAADDAAGASYDPDALDESTWQSVKCALKRDFSDTMPEALDGNAIRDKVTNYFASEWGLDLLTNAIFVDALRGINASSFTNAMSAGASYDSADCDCPEVSDNFETDPSENGWYLSRYTELTVNDEGDYNTYMCNKIVAGHDAYGCLVTATWNNPPSAGLVPMGAATCGCTGYDLSAWGDTSQHVEWSDKLANLAGMEDDIADEIFGADEWDELICGYETDVIESPIAEVGNTITHGFDGRDMEPGDYYTIRVRLLHNTGSPSHS